ncbi:N-formylglutamate amidohydrolase [Mucilaginibacter pallidiroseus]|uniref:N-formylglutamate amidohydrolase n=1 Tax=Mucilaginibacter pallidiroseus TaxID=2599295 RepID=A0A563UGN3_9SPHI|nr:N-formylglutamate amidohydrolase [Mucilaginibacter pallidiroseus]TWR30466.1 N-formylglutamate amidohydrolase [Mucilaginibacter pallidiroseus]
MTKNTILHIPYASTNIPDYTGYLVTNQVLENEMLGLTDWFIDDLFYLPDSITVKANFSRLFCDVKRFGNEKNEVLGELDIGSTQTAKVGEIHLRKVTHEVNTKILNDYYYPHHLKLSNAVADKLSINGEALIIDCRSFTNEPFKRYVNHDTPRFDFHIGLDDYHTPRSLYKLTIVGLKMLGYTVKIITPYSYPIVPRVYYQQDKRVMSIAIEINRDLYLMPGTNERSNGYLEAKTNIFKLLSFICSNQYDVNKALPIVKGVNN